MRIYPIFYISLLEPQKGRKGKVYIESILLTNKAQEQEIKKILNPYKEKGKRFFLIKQKGQLEEYNQYKPKKNYIYIENKIAVYKEIQKAQKKKQKKKKR